MTKRKMNTVSDDKEATISAACATTFDTTLLSSTGQNLWANFDVRK